MINQDEKNKRMEELRKQAEKKLPSASESRAETESELKRIVYELQVHKVELEIQNEELQRSRLEIEKSHNEYADLYNFAPIQYFTLNQDGYIIKHNLLAAQLLGYERKYLHHKRLINFVAPEYTNVYNNFIKALQESGGKQITQLELMTRTGERRVVQLQGTLSRLQEKGSIKFFEILLTATDITDLKKAEAEVRLAERFRHIIEGIPGIYLFLAPNYVVLEASNNFLQTFHLARAKVVGYTVAELFTQAGTHNNFTAALLQSLLQVTYNQKPHTTQVLRYDVSLPDGRKQESYWRITHSPVLNQYKQVNYIILQMVDVTREYLAQQEVESSRQRFEMLALATNDIVWEWNVITGVWWWNQNIESQFGYKRDTLETGMESWANRLHPEDKTQAVTRLMNTVTSSHTEYRHEYRFCQANGTYAYVLDRAFAQQDENGKTIRLLGTMVDITQQKEAEHALRKINKRFALLLDTIPQLAWISESDGIPFFYNQKWYTYTGATIHDLKGRGWQQYIHPDDREQTFQIWQEALRTKTIAHLQSRWRRTSDNQYRWHVGQIIPVFDEKGQILNWVGSFTDIHDQKLIEEALRDNTGLREAQRKLQLERDFSRSLVDNSVDGIFTFDSAPCYTSWNPVLESMFGIRREEVVNKKIFEVFPEYEPTEEGQAILQVLQGKKSTLYNQPYENKEGYYELNLIPLRNEEGKVIGGLGIMHDVTEHIKLEEERTTLKLKRQKDLLNAILEAQEGERRRIAEGLHNGLAQTLYAAKLKLEQMPVEQASRNKLIESRENVNQLLANAILETRHISHELIPTILDDFGLKGAIQDFCKKYASPHLVIKAEMYGLDEPINKNLEIAIYRIAQELVNNVIKHAQANRLHIHLVKGELGIMLKVADNGKGFDPDTVMQTRKGIGLKTIQDRVKLLNGSLGIESKLDAGTTITIKIPMS